jgi:hypothetical protein
MGKFTGNFITQFMEALSYPDKKGIVYDLHELQNVYHERIYEYLYSYGDSVSQSRTLSKFNCIKVIKMYYSMSAVLK